MRQIARLAPWCLWALLGHGICVAGTAAQESATARLRVSEGSPAECVGGEELSALVESRLGRALSASSGPTDYVVRVDFGRIALGYGASVALETSDGESLGSRRVESASLRCRDMDASLSVVVAVMLNMPGEEMVIHAEPTLPAEVPLDRSGWRTEARARATLAVGLLPKPAVGFGVAVAITPPTLWPIEIDFTAYPGADRELAPGQATFQYFAGGVALCPELLEGWARLSGCVGMEAGALRVTTQGFDESGHHSDLVLMPKLGLGLSLHVHSYLWLHVRTTGAVPLRRDPHVLERPTGQERFHRMWPVVGLAEASLNLRFE